MTMKTYTNLKILFPYIKKSKRYLIFGIMGILIASAIVAPVPYFIGNVLDVLVKENVTFSDIKKASENVLKEIQNKYKIHENIYNELRKKLNSNID